MLLRERATNLIVKRGSTTSNKRKQKSKKQDKKGSARTTNPCALYAPHPSVGLLHSPLFAAIVDKVNIYINYLVLARSKKRAKAAAEESDGDEDDKKDTVLCTYIFTCQCTCLPCMMTRKHA